MAELKLNSILTANDSVFILLQFSSVQYFITNHHHVCISGGDYSVMWLCGVMARLLDPCIQNRQNGYTEFDSHQLAN